MLFAGAFGYYRCCGDHWKCVVGSVLCCKLNAGRVFICFLADLLYKLFSVGFREVYDNLVWIGLLYDSGKALDLDLVEAHVISHRVYILGRKLMFKAAAKILDVFPQTLS
jgi:hypothetical protein